MRFQQRRWSVLAVALLLAVAAGTADAGPKPKKLRRHVAELQAKLAQLESQMQFQNHRLDRMMPWVATGSSCADPCTLDTDGDGQNDCVDPCPCDPQDRDDDGDGFADCIDPCPGDASNACIDPCNPDSDGDGVHDCEDMCPFDAHASGDRDGDAIADCNDPCPDDDHNGCTGPCMLDSDGDGLGDCMDPCPFGESSDPMCEGHTEMEPHP